MKTALLRLSILIAGIGVPSIAGAVTDQCAGVEAVGGTCTSGGLESHINNIINGLFIVVGAITVIIIIVAGIRYITSTGDATRVTAAKNTLLYAVIGLIIVILARAIVGFVITAIA